MERGKRAKGPPLKAQGFPGPILGCGGGGIGVGSRKAWEVAKQGSPSTGNPPRTVFLLRHRAVKPTAAVPRSWFMRFPSLLSWESDVGRWSATRDTHRSFRPDDIC